MQFENIDILCCMHIGFHGLTFINEKFQCKGMGEKNCMFWCTSVVACHVFYVIVRYSGNKLQFLNLSLYWVHELLLYPFSCNSCKKSFRFVRSVVASNIENALFSFLVFVVTMCITMLYYIMPLDKARASNQWHCCKTIVHIDWLTSLPFWKCVFIFTLVMPVI